MVRWRRRAWVTRSGMDMCVHTAFLGCGRSGLWGLFAVGCGQLFFAAFRGVDVYLFGSIVPIRLTCMGLEAPKFSVVTDRPLLGQFHGGLG